MTALQQIDAPISKTASRKPAKGLSHNLNGQRLGRKGRDTRDRIIAATRELLDDPTETQITLSAVARKLSMGMTSLYNYFGDLTELLLAVLEPVMATAEDDYLRHLREHWPDDELGEHCYIFMRDYYAFWQKHSRILHLRNSLSETNREERMSKHRINTGIPMVRLLTFQMNADPDVTDSPEYSMATALFTGIDRLVAVRTATEWSIPQQEAYKTNAKFQLRAEARLLEIAIRDGRLGLDFGEEM